MTCGSAGAAGSIDPFEWRVVTNHETQWGLQPRLFLILILFSFSFVYTVKQWLLYPLGPFTCYNIVDYRMKKKKIEFNVAIFCMLDRRRDRKEVMSSGITADWTGLFKMKKSNFRLLLLIAFYGLFLILGAAIFSAIESPLEVAEVKNMRDRKNHFLRTHSCITGKWFEVHHQQVVSLLIGTPLQNYRNSINLLTVLQ